MGAAHTSERQALDAAIKRAVGSAPFVRAISAALAGVLTPEDGTCVLPPVCQQSRSVVFKNPRYGMHYMVEDSAGYEISVHMATGEFFHRKWIGSESRIDGNGVCWQRHIGQMVMDDFGNLVEVQ
jgi:hypothetical protein